MFLAIKSTDEHRWFHSGNLASILPFRTNHTMVVLLAHKSVNYEAFHSERVLKSCQITGSYWAPLRGRPFLSLQSFKVCWENNSWKAVITA